MVGTFDGKSAEGKTSSLQRALYIYLKEGIIVGFILIEMYSMESSLILF